ncbi:ATP-dependent DNA helicase PIF7-like [Leptidea sinapis]|uniref:ATP-dependent DNA helicase PIF7-like n=1 Tax=Leptidea sinapis TaxID=189913 RepID=UPI0021C3FA0F|nr:ATP-dependent DNA helicase PIF7-like [Leptidea sinapis]
MSDDILARLRRENQDMNITFNDNIYNEALIILEDRCFAICNQTLVTLGVQSPKRNELSVTNSELSKELNYNKDELQRYIEENEPKLTRTQRIVYNTIINRIETNAGGIIFLDAPGGTGKTFLINLVLATIRVKNEIALALASSGIAATLMEGGKTAHSTLNLPLNVAEQEFPVCNITKFSVRGQILIRCKLIIWDECTMAHRKSLEALDRTLQDLRKNTKLMGDALLLLSGDFRQTLPVIPKSTPADEINACLKRSIFWNNVEKLSLTENMRALITGDPKAQEFADNLLKIGNGTYPLDPQSGKIILTEEICHVVYHMTYLFSISDMHKVFLTPYRQNLSIHTTKLFK